MRQALVDGLRELLPRTRVEDATVPVARPVGDDEWRAVLALAERTGAKVLVRGTDTKRGERPAPERVDLVLSTAADDAVVAYEPGDGVVTARAGAPLASLREVVAAGGHQLVPLLVPDHGTPCGTLGGAVAAGRSGAARLRHGPLRHHVLGARALLADGTIAKSGGALVKNVTGYDLHRTWTGSHGALGALLEVSLRLVPTPARVERAEVTVRDVGQGLALGRAVAEGPRAPFAVELVADARGARLVVHHAGTKASVADAWRASRELAPTLDEPRRVDAPAFELAPEPGGETLLWLGTRPAAFAGAWSTLAELLGDRRTSALLRPGIGEGLVALDADETELLDLEHDLAHRDLDARWRRAPDAVLARALERERLAPGFDPMRRLRTRFDPRARFAPGRFFGGL